MFSLSTLLVRAAALALISNTVHVIGDDCQPWTWNWKRQVGEVGEIRCRYTVKTDAAVNYWTCSELSLRYGIKVEHFFELNPGVATNCSNIQPNTTYCVSGRKQPLVALDGKCGPQNKNATCLGTPAQCCNSKTWTCGNSEEDCAPGTCFDGACAGANIYAIDGKCGPKNSNRKCGGRWGDCCNFDGVCGTGANFCGKGKCESGNCTEPLDQLPAPGSNNITWDAGTTPDGSCGGTKGYTCGVLWGSCCDAKGTCGSGEACQTGCQTKYGKCFNGTELAFGKDYVGKKP